MTLWGRKWKQFTINSSYHLYLFIYEEELVFLELINDCTLFCHNSIKKIVLNMIFLAANINVFTD